jgi:hypothetical protein
MSLINPLGDLCNYSKLKILFDKNKDKDWTEWLEYDSLFGKPGKQGVVGILKVKGTDMTVAFKVSQCTDNLVPHEYTVMNGLTDLAGYCPHFCKSLGILECMRNPRIMTTTNPFIKGPDVSYMVPDKMLVAEHINKSNKLYNYIQSKKIDEGILYSTVKQILMALALAQHKKQFSHYDLHSLNILMRKCNKDVVFLYVIDEENQICVPTLGHFPIIIDFGFSYINDMEDAPLLPTMGHTSSGFLSDRFDKIVDPKLFLVTVSDEIKTSRRSKDSNKLKKIVKNAFAPLDIDWFSGWDNNDDDNLTDEITKITCDYSDKSVLFTNYENHCIDLIQSLIILPIEKQKHENPKKAFKAFLKEWMKIENQISNEQYNLYILRSLVDSARYVRAAYMDDETSKQAVQDFATMLHEAVGKIAKFFNPKPAIDYEKMLCSLYVFSTDIEGIFYDAMKERMEQKEQDYAKLPLNTPEQLYAAIDTAIPTKYVYNENTVIYMMDSISGDTKVFSIDPKDVKRINDSHPFVRGTMIYDMYKT